MLTLCAIGIAIILALLVLNWAVRRYLGGLD